MGIKLPKNILQVRETIETTLRNLGVSLSNNTVFGQLIRVVNGLYENALFFVEDAITEQNKYTVQRRKSILALASQSGYEPFQGSASRSYVDIFVKTNNIHTGKLLIPNNSRLLNTKNGLYYTLKIPNNSEYYVIDLSTDHKAHRFELLQGVVQNFTFPYRIQETYVVHLDYNGYVDITTISVKINGVVITPYDYESSRGYLLKHSIRGGMDLVIIDNHTQWRKYDYGTNENQVKMEVEIITHDGAKANTNAINGVSYDDFTFVDSLSLDNLQEVNSVDILGIKTIQTILGSNPDSTNKVREMIGMNSRTEVLTSPEHYQAFLSRFAIIGWSKTWSESGRVISKLQKNFKLKLKQSSDYLNLTKDDFQFTEVELDLIKNTVLNSGKVLMGTTFEILPVNPKAYAVQIFLKPKNKLTSSLHLHPIIESIILKYFIDNESIKDQYIGKSEIINALMNNSDISKEIESLDLYFLSEANEKAKSDGYYEQNIYEYHPIKGYTFSRKERIPVLSYGRDPQIGLDEHGNIELNNPEDIPVLLGGWSWKNQQGQEISITKPIMIWPS